MKAQNRYNSFIHVHSRIISFFNIETALTTNTSPVTTTERLRKRTGVLQPSECY